MDQIIPLPKSESIRSFLLILFDYYFIHAAMDGFNSLAGGELFSYNFLKPKPRVSKTSFTMTNELGSTFLISCLNLGSSRLWTIT